MIKIDITEEDIKKAKGQVIQASLKAKSYYETKSNDEILELFRQQVFMHEFGSVSSRDDVEYWTVEGILLERGFTELKLHKIYAEVVEQGEKWQKYWNTIYEIQEAEGGHYNSKYNCTEWIETIIRNLDYPMIARLELKLIRNDLNTNGHIDFLETLQLLKDNRKLKVSQWRYCINFEKGKGEWKIK